MVLTNNCTLPALTVAQCSEARWQVELFFTGIKQRLRITAFSGTSPTIAVTTQVSLEVSVSVLVAIVKKPLGLWQYLYPILHVLSVSLFEKVPIHQALALVADTTSAIDDGNRLSLFTLEPDGRGRR